jgi:hypothetical protein
MRLTVTPRVVNLLLVLVLLGFFAAVTLTAPRWARRFSETAPAVADEEPTAEAASADHSPSPAPRPAATAEARGTISVKLFFEAADRSGLVVEERSVPLSAELAQQSRAVVEELVHGSQSGLLPPLNPKTRVLDVFVTARGVAYVDLSGDVTQEHEGGSEAEMLTVYAVVNSIVENFPAIRRVQILVDDRPIETLAGHLDLSRPLSADMTLLATAPASPAAAPAP